MGLEMLFTLKLQSILTFNIYAYKKQNVSYWEISGIHAKVILSQRITSPKNPARESLIDTIVRLIVNVIISVSLN